MNIRSWLFRRKPAATAPLDLNARAIASDPYPHYERLRAAGSVQFLPHHSTWLVLGYDDVQTAFMRPNVFSNAPYALVDDVLLAADPPAHPVMRRIVMRYFAADVLERLQGFAEQRAASLLKSQLDIVAEYAVALSESVAAELIGFSEQDLEKIHAAYAAAPELDPYTRALDRIAANATMYGRLLADGLDDRQARSIVRLVWLAAVTTTERAISWCVMRLLQHNDVRDELERNPARTPAFVEEVLRLHPPELMVPRMTTEETQLGGVAIPVGAIVHLVIAAANRDPNKFADPSALRLDRPATRHFSFGSGIHHCVGAALGRRTIETAVSTLLQRAPRFHAAQPLTESIDWCTMTANPIGRLRVELE